MELTEFTEKDYGSLKGFMEPLWRQTYAEILPKEQLEYLIEFYFSDDAIRGFRDKGYRYFRLSDGDLRGVVVILEREKDVYLDKLYLLPEARGKGCAEFVFRELEKFGKDITLNVNRENARAVNCYRKNGFAVERQEEILLGNGMVNQDYFMRRKTQKKGNEA